MILFLNCNRQFLVGLGGFVARGREIFRNIPGNIASGLQEYYSTRQILLTSCLRLGFARTPEKKGWGVPGLFGVLGWGHGRLRKWSGRDRAAGSCIPSKNVQITSQCETAQPSQNQTSYTRASLQGTQARPQSSCSVMLPGRRERSNDLFTSTQSSEDDNSW